MFEGFEKVGLLQCDILVSFHNLESSDLAGVVLASGEDGAKVAVTDLFQNFVFAVYLHLYALSAASYTKPFHEGWTMRPAYRRRLDKGN